MHAMQENNNSNPHASAICRELQLQSVGVDRRRTGTYTPNQKFAMPGVASSAERSRSFWAPPKLLGAKKFLFQSLGSHIRNRALTVAHSSRNAVRRPRRAGLRRNCARWSPRRVCSAKGQAAGPHSIHVRSGGMRSVRSRC